MGSHAEVARHIGAGYAEGVGSSHRAGVDRIPHHHVSQAGRHPRAPRFIAALVVRVDHLSYFVDRSLLRRVDDHHRLGPVAAVGRCRSPAAVLEDCDAHHRHRSPTVPVADGVAETVRQRLRPVVGVAEAAVIG